MKSYLRILNAIYNTPWAILPEKLDAIVAFIEAKAEGRISLKTSPPESVLQIHGTLKPDALKKLRERWEKGFAGQDDETILVLEAGEDIQVMKAQTTPAVRQSGSIAILPLFGTITHRANMISEFSGGTSTEKFSAQLRQVVADPTVKAIVIDVDSPGGNVDGVDELATEIFKARNQKPIVAVANSMAASAAFWIASAASEVVVIPSGLVGSIGIVAIHHDVSKQAENEGVKITLISAGRFKTEGNSFEPLGDEAREAIQKLADDFMGMFVKAVARNRDVPVSEVRNGFGEGRLVSAKDALRLGMVDRIGTMDETLKRLNGNRSGTKTALAKKRLDLVSVQK